MSKIKKKERIRQLEAELETTREKLEKARIHNGQEEKRVTELIKTLDGLQHNYLEKIKELEAIRYEYTELKSGLESLSTALKAKKLGKPEQ